MTGSGEAAEELVRMMLSFGDVTVRLGGSALKNVLAMTLALAKNNKKLSGKVNMTRMLRETRELRTVPMTPEQYREFRTLARRRRILFSTIRDRDNRGRLVDVVIPVTEADRANPIFERVLRQTREAERDTPEREEPVPDRERREPEPEREQVQEQARGEERAEPEHAVPFWELSRDGTEPAERTEPEPAEPPPRSEDPDLDFDLDIDEVKTEAEPSKKDSPSSRDSPATRRNANTSRDSSSGGRTTSERVSVEARLRGYRARLDERNGDREKVRVRAKAKGER